MNLMRRLFRAIDALAYGITALLSAQKSAGRIAAKNIGRGLYHRLETLARGY